ncbi:hypothetical protein GGQ54_000247 [Naumannella cuiyingiana]|uniref:Transporter n=1 Tax=Naumannella cuiyingiana TaxID=1347891 RepID=A0A7Z0D6A6_9ACTN|nr:AmiS/UreI family transporter [Naumannella cuiyingiana]NYI69687.1 hypothetical protein [Naumannella cuiyingiana]
MGAIGLFYVGAVLIVNGLMLLGRITPKGAAPLNLMVGSMQVIFPTLALINSGGEPAAVLAAAPIYLFGFTYLWVGVANATGWGAEGLGWFSLFVAVSAVVFGGYAFTAQADPGFGVIWLLWAVLWAMFFVLLARGRAEWAPATGIVATGEGVLTAVVGILIVFDRWQSTAEAAVVIAILGGALVVVSAVLGRRLATAPPSTTDTDTDADTDERSVRT